MLNIGGMASCGSVLIIRMAIVMENINGGMRMVYYGHILITKMAFSMENIKRGIRMVN